MTYIYLIESVYHQGHRYGGLTTDLGKRFGHHNEGKSPHTRKFKPWNLVAYTAFADHPTAVAYEKYLKSGSGKTFLKRHFFRNGGSSSWLTDTGDASAPMTPPPPHRI